MSCVQYSTEKKGEEKKRHHVAMARESKYRKLALYRKSTLHHTEGVFRTTKAIDYVFAAILVFSFYTHLPKAPSCSPPASSRF
mmetsp:Transcript_21592/g.56073  ORF Transcript_21592/g.56073 Transcript_21592/m.56073 type:complete len:83 (+) Transcript_21592:1356-1604(+)